MTLCFPHRKSDCDVAKNVCRGSRTYLRRWRFAVFCCDLKVIHKILINQKTRRKKERSTKRWPHATLFADHATKQRHFVFIPYRVFRDNRSKRLDESFPKPSGLMTARNLDRLYINWSRKPCFTINGFVLRTELICNVMMSSERCLVWYICIIIQWVAFLNLLHLTPINLKRKCLEFFMTFFLFGSKCLRSPHCV